MSFEVLCGQCGARFTLPDDLYERKVKGRAVTVRCKKCRADIAVNGVELESHPSHEAPSDETPTEPLSLPVSSVPVGGLWVVSFGEDDDRELTAGQIKQSLARGEISVETLVWNTSMDEWLSIGEVPELRALVPAQLKTGGFLGTGVQVENAVREPALRRSSRPPPKPSAEESDLLGDDEIGPFRSVSAGTMRNEADASEARAGAVEPAPARPVEGTPTVPLVRAADVAAVSAPEPSEPASSKPPPKPAKRLPTIPPKKRPDWMPEQPAAEAKAPAPPSEEEEEEEAPVSGTPDLQSLMTEARKPEEKQPETSDEKISDDIFAMGGGGIAAQLPGIDLANLPPPSSRRSQEEEPPPSSRRDAEPDAPKKARPKAPSAKAKETKAKDSKATPARAAEEPKSGGGLTWLALGAAALLAVWWFFLRSPAAETQPGPQLTATQAAPETPVTTGIAPDPAPPTTDTPAADAAEKPTPGATTAEPNAKPGKEPNLEPD